MSGQVKEWVSGFGAKIAIKQGYVMFSQLFVKYLDRAVRGVLARNLARVTLEKHGYG